MDKQIAGNYSRLSTVAKRAKLGELYTIYGISGRNKVSIATYSSSNLPNTDESKSDEQPDIVVGGGGGGGGLDSKSGLLFSVPTYIQ